MTPAGPAIYPPICAIFKPIDARFKNASVQLPSRELVITSYPLIARPSPGNTLKNTVLRIGRIPGDFINFATFAASGAGNAFAALAA